MSDVEFERTIKQRPGTVAIPRPAKDQKPADPRVLHESFVGRMRKDFERMTGHTPTEAESRRIEQKAGQVANNVHNKGSK